MGDRISYIVYNSITDTNLNAKYKGHGGANNIANFEVTILRGKDSVKRVSVKVMGYYLKHRL